MKERYYYHPSPSSTLPVEIDTSVNENDVFHGVVVGEGDGTVPLLSLGYLCSKGWHNVTLFSSFSPYFLFFLIIIIERLESRRSANSNERVPTQCDVIIRRSKGRI